MRPSRPPRSPLIGEGPGLDAGSGHWALAVLYGLGKGRTPLMFVLNPSSSESSGNTTRSNKLKSIPSIGSASKTATLQSSPMQGIA